MARITMVAPFPDTWVLTRFGKEEFKHIPDLTVVSLERGLDEIITYADIEYHIGLLLDKVVEIEKQGDCDALIIGCFADPGLLAVRQMTSMPVLGPGETSLCVAAMLGHKIGVIVPESHLIPALEKMIHTYQFTERVVTVTSSEEFLPETVQTRPQESVAKMADTCLRVVREHDADVLILGCIGFSWMIEQVRELIAQEGITTPIIEPGITAYNAAKMLVELGLNHDRRKLRPMGR